MENITKEKISAFIANSELVLKATQAKLCVPIINRIFKKMKAGIYFVPLRVDGDILCNGHHRYIASLLSGKPIKTVPSVASPSVSVTAWANVILEDEDWDSEIQIDTLNKQDALSNGITLQELLVLLR